MTDKRETYRDLYKNARMLVILKLIFDLGGCATVAQIADLLGVHHEGVTDNVNKLAERNMITRPRTYSGWFITKLGMDFLKPDAQKTEPVLPPGNQQPAANRVTTPQIAAGKHQEDFENPQPDASQRAARNPQPDAEIPLPHAENPPPGAENPQSGAEIPQPHAEIPPSHAEIPPPHAEIPQPGAENPQLNNITFTTTEINQDLLINYQEVTIKESINYSENPQPDAENPPPDAEYPPPDAEIPPPDAEIPPPDAEIPPPDAEIPPPDAEIPQPGAENPQQIAGNLPLFAGNLPAEAFKANLGPYQPANKQPELAKTVWRAFSELGILRNQKSEQVASTPGLTYDGVMRQWQRMRERGRAWQGLLLQVIPNMQPWELRGHSKICRCADCWEDHLRLEREKGIRR